MVVVMMMIMMTVTLAGSCNADVNGGEDEGCFVVGATTAQHVTAASTSCYRCLYRVGRDGRDANKACDAK